MYLQDITGVLQGQEVKIKYDCCGNFETCGQERMLKLKYAEKNFKDNQQKHICRKCQLKFKNPMFKNEIKEKVKETCEQRYGGLAMNTPESIENRKKMFQDENFVKQRTEKTKKTYLEKYGVDHPMHLQSIKDKQKQVMQEKYGVDHPYQSQEIMQKMKENNFKKYGVENVAQLPEVQLKMASTTFEKYGVEHYNQLPEMKEYLRENCREWLAESWANPWSKGIERPEEWNQKQSQTVTKLIGEGKWNSVSNHSLKGKYKSKKCRKKNPSFRSSYELKVHSHLDNSDDVDWYDYEPFKVSYYDAEGHKRYYIVDFVVKYKSGRLLAIEVKNDYSVKLELNLIKKEAFKKECSDLEYETWSNEKIKSLNIDLETLLESSLIKYL